MDSVALNRCLGEIGMELSAEQQLAFEGFEAALYEANVAKNLTRVPREECWVRHFLDSLLFQDLIPQGASVLDIGTGPGFPAWPLACARPDIRVTALDSNGKMLDFLRTQPLKNLKVVLARAEEWPEREKFDVVTGRAVSPLPIQLELSVAFARVKGLLLPMRVSGDMDAAQAFPTGLIGIQLERIESRVLAGDAVRLFPIYRKLVRTSKNVPRRWSEMKARPLGS